MSENSPGVIVCPQCGRPNGASASGPAGRCQFCDAPLETLQPAVFERSLPWVGNRGSRAGFIIALVVGLFGFGYGVYLMQNGVPLTSIPGLFYMGMMVVFSYFGAAGLVNNSHLSVSDGVLSVRNTPLPWPGNHRVALDEIRSLQIHLHGLRNRKSHRLDAETTDGGWVPLLTDFDDPAPLKQLAAELQPLLTAAAHPDGGRPDGGEKG